MNAAEITAYSGWKVNGQLEEFGWEDLYLKNAMSVMVLKELMAYWVE